MKTLSADEMRKVNGACNHWWMAAGEWVVNAAPWWNWNLFRFQSRKLHKHLYTCRYCGSRKTIEYYTYH